MAKDKLTIALYTCDECRCETSKPDDDGYTIYCPQCGSERIKITGTRPVRWVSVAVYIVDRAYGGPEEGGWYYDEGSLDYEHIGQTMVTDDINAAMAHYRALQDTILKPSRPKYFIEKMPPTSWPESRPRYS